MTPAERKKLGPLMKRCTLSALTRLQVLRHRYQWEVLGPALLRADDLRTSRNGSEIDRCDIDYAMAERSNR